MPSSVAIGPNPPQPFRRNSLLFGTTQDPLPDKYDEQYLQHTFEYFPVRNFTWAWDIDSIRTAREAQMAGYLNVAAHLGRDMKTDPSIYACLLNRIAPALGLPQSMLAPDGTGHAFRSGGLAERVRAEAESTFGPYGTALPNEVVADIIESLAIHGLWVGQNIWTPRADGTRIDVRLETFPMQFVRWYPTKRRLLAQTTDGVVTVEPGDGKWVVIQRRDFLPWQSGSLIPLALVWPDRAFGVRDRSKNAESHGEVKWIGTPAEGTPVESPEGDQFAKDLQSLYRARSGMVKPYGFEVQKEEAMSQAWQIFRELIKGDDSDIARILLGQDGTVSNSGGNYIKSDVLFGVRNDIVETDLAVTERGARGHTLRPWAAINFGNVDVTPCKHWELPDLNEEAKRDSLAKRTKEFNAILAGYRSNGFVIDQPFVDYLAKEFDVTAPKLGQLPPQEAVTTTIRTEE